MGTRRIHTTKKQYQHVPTPQRGPFLAIKTSEHTKLVDWFRWQRELESSAPAFRTFTNPELEAPSGACRHANVSRWRYRFGGLGHNQAGTQASHFGLEKKSDAASHMASDDRQASLRQQTPVVRSQESPASRLPQAATDMGPPSGSERAIDAPLRIFRQ